MSLWILTEVGKDRATLRCPFYSDWKRSVAIGYFPTYDIGDKPAVYCQACMFPHPLPGPYARHTQVHGKRPEWDPVENEDKQDPEPSIEEKLKAAEDAIRKAKDESRRHIEQDGSFDRDEVRGNIVSDGEAKQSSESVSGERDREHD